MKKNAKQLENEYHFQTYNRMPLIIKKGKGTKLIDSEGKEYIDALGGIAVMATGYSHPKVIKAINDQAQNLIHCSNIYYNEPQSILAEKLTRLAGMERIFFCNSGVEAMEGAIKLARKVGNSKGKKGNIISFTNCFHGRTLATIAMGKNKYQEGFQPIPQGFEILPFNDIGIASKKIDRNTIAVVVEPVQGEGGIIPASKEFLKVLREICTNNDVLLIFDEIQCGIGRTGSFMAYQHYGVKPDIVTNAKSLGSGFPIGSIMTSSKLSNFLSKGSHGTTFGGGPLACAAAKATLEVIEEENLIQKAKENGKYFIGLLKEKTKKIEQVKEIRGVGLMIGVELTFKCANVILSMMNKGVLANCTADNTIRFLPPLNISRNDIDTIVNVMIESITKESKNA
jgi:acetylornithine/N-succinyldiaminopimelate aminotransferase